MTTETKKAPRWAIAETIAYLSQCLGGSCEQGRDDWYLIYCKWDYMGNIKTVYNDKACDYVAINIVTGECTIGDDIPENKMYELMGFFHRPYKGTWESYQLKQKPSITDNYPDPWHQKTE
jgi:hypothetical protein